MGAFDKPVTSETYGARDSGNFGVESAKYDEPLLPLVTMLVLKRSPISLAGPVT